MLEANTMLDEPLEEEIRDLEIPKIVKIEDLFDQELLDSIDHTSLEICIL